MYPHSGSWMIPVLDHCHSYIHIFFQLMVEYCHFKLPAFVSLCVAFAIFFF
jgi:hypothetical protein